VGTTVRRAELPEDLLADEHHQTRDGQKGHLHGSPAACDQHCRAWALLDNFAPWHPATAEENDDWQSPAERLSRHRYHDNWLQNLLVSASPGGCQNHAPQQP